MDIDVHIYLSLSEDAKEGVMVLKKANKKKGRRYGALFINQIPEQQKRVRVCLHSSLSHNRKGVKCCRSNGKYEVSLFYGSILALEAIFFMYYTTWNLFQTLPAAVGVGAITFLSGSRALSEVQERRLAGLR